MLEWTENQRQIVLTALTERRRPPLEERECLAISWPPEAHLWRPGDAYETEGEYCDHHDDDYRNDCEECRGCERPQLVVDDAEWHWEVRVTWFEREEGEVADEVLDEFPTVIMRTYVDPRLVDYAEGEWDR